MSEELFVFARKIGAVAAALREWACLEEQKEDGIPVSYDAMVARDQFRDLFEAMTAEGQKYMFRQLSQ